jgi:hypothetical protein
MSLRSVKATGELRVRPHNPLYLLVSVLKSPVNRPASGARDLPD